MKLYFLALLVAIPAIAMEPEEHATPPSSPVKICPSAPKKARNEIQPNSTKQKVKSLRYQAACKVHTLLAYAPEDQQRAIINSLPRDINEFLIESANSLSVNSQKISRFDTTQLVPPTEEEVISRVMAATGKRVNRKVNF